MEINKRSLPSQETTSIINNNNTKIIKLYKANNYNKLITLSLCFNNNNKYIQEKLDTIIEIIKSNMVSIIHISNIMHDNFIYLDNKLKHLYENVQVFKTENISCGSVIFLHKKQLTFIKSADNPYYFDLENSNLERKIIGCEVSFYKNNDTIKEELKVNILGIHLESGRENESICFDQISILSGIIKELQLSDYIILGNFETANYDYGNIIKSLGQNVWNELGCSMLTRGDNTEKIIYNTEKIYPSNYASLIKSDNVPEKYSVYTGILCSFGMK